MLGYCCHLSVSVRSNFFQMEWASGTTYVNQIAHAYMDTHLGTICVWKKTRWNWKRHWKMNVPLYVIISNCRHLIIIHINYSLFIFIHLSLAPDLCWSLLISQTVAGGGPMVGLLTSLSETQRQHEALCGEARPVRLRTRLSQMPEVRRVKEASSSLSWQYTAKVCKALVNVHMIHICSS